MQICYFVTDTLGFPDWIVMPQDRHYPRQLIKHPTTTLWWVEKKSVGKILKNGHKQLFFYEILKKKQKNRSFFVKTSKRSSECSKEGKKDKW